MIAAACLVILLVAVSSNTQAQFLGYPAVPYYAQYPGGYYGFNPVAPSIDLNSLGPFGTRLLFSNGPLVNAVRQTLTLVTTTSVTTVTVSTTCTTSTTTLSSCTVASRRRRTSLLANGSPFVDAQEETEDESIFLPKK